MGVGLPVARHRNVTFEPSRTITSLELSESSMLGGTVGGRENILISALCWRKDCDMLLWALPRRFTLSGHLPK